MSSETDLCIIIVNWNTSNLLAGCLESVLSQKSTDSTEAHQLAIETVVVDNASDDDSVLMVRQAYPWVHLIANSENVGFAQANNQAISASNSRYVLLLNSDTVIPSEALLTLVQFADAHPKAGIVGAKLVNPDGSFQAGPNRFPTLASVILASWGVIQKTTRNAYYPSFPPERSHVPMRCDWVGGACLLARCAAIEQIGLLDEQFFMNSEEVDWCYRMYQSGWEVWYTPNPAVVHYGGASARRSTAVQRLRDYRGKVIFLSKHHGSVTGGLARTNFRIASFIKALAYQTLSLVRHDSSYREHAMSHWAVLQEGAWAQKS